MNKVFPNLHLNLGVSERHAMPLYQQVYLILREKLRAGEYGERIMPTDDEFCRIFGVSKITVKRAMQMLTHDGLVMRRRGAGTYASQQASPGPRRNAIDDLVQSVEAIGAATGIRRVSHGPIPASIEVADKLYVSPDTLVKIITQIRMSGREPIALVHSYLPLPVADRLFDQVESDLPVLAQLHRAGITIGRAEQALGATVADPYIANHLGIGVGMPVLKLTRQVFDTEYRPVQWLVALYRADRYEYRTSLRRDSLDAAGTTTMKSEPLKSEHNA